MTLRLRVLAVPCLGALLLVVPRVAHPQPAQDLEPLLAAPVSAGTEALLVRHAKDTRVPMRWLGNLRHDDPLVRATAARALSVTGVSAAVGRLRVALASETDHGAAAEQALGLLLLGDGAHDAYALTRLANADDASLARGLVIVTALRPDSLATHLTHLRATWPDRPLPLAYPLARLHATAGDGALVAFEAAAVSEQDRHAIVALLDMARHRDRALPEAFVRHASARGDLDYEVAEYVASRYERPGAVRGGPRYQFLADRTPGQVDDLQTQSERTALQEVVRRWLSQPSRPNLSDDLRNVGHQARRWSEHLAQVLTDAERRVLIERLDIAEQRFGLWTSRPAGRRPDLHPVTLMSELPRGLVADLMRVTACKGTSTHDSVVAITYRPDGRASAVSRPTVTSGATLPPACTVVFETLASLSYETLSPHDPGTRSVFLRFDDDFVACQSARAAPYEVGELAATDRNGRAKLRDVKPVYPKAAIQARQQGVVLIELTVNAAGCVVRARVASSVSLSLDAAAMQAASRWTFAPSPAAREFTELVSVHFWLQ